MPAPHDQAFCDRARRLCELHPQVRVAELMGTSEGIIHRIKRRGFIAARGPASRPIPYDFALLAHKMTFKQLCAHYGAGESTMAKWCRTVGRKPQYRAGRVLPVPSRAMLVEAIADASSFTELARSFEVDETTLLRWRRIHKVEKVRAGHDADQEIGWVERYIAQKRA